MALFQYKFPELGEGLHEGEIVKLHIKAGDKITDEDIIMDVQNDKAVVEVPSPVNGTVVEVKVKEGEVCNIGQVVAVIEAEGDIPEQDDADTEGTAEEKVKDNLGEAVVENVQESQLDEAQPIEGGEQAAGKPAVTPKEVLATPSVRKLARDKGISIADVPATGKNGRVTREDVEQFVSGGGSSAAEEAKPEKGAQASKAVSAAPGERPEERVPFKGIRKVIANAMAKSVYTAPHVTIMDEVDVSQLVALRQKGKAVAEKKGVKLTYLPFIVKALVAAVREFPVLNAMIDEENNEIVYKKYYNIGIAADTDNGLIVPVVNDADRKNIWTIAGEIADLAARGREGKLGPNEMKGSTISITNIGSAGGMFFTPVINFPEVAILGTGRISEKPVVKNGEIVAAPVMALSLSFDHRIIDGATAQYCMNYIKQLLSDPELLVMEV